MAFYFFRKVANADFDYFCVLTYYPVPEKTTTVVEMAKLFASDLTLSEGVD